MLKEDCLVRLPDFVTRTVVFVEGRCVFTDESVGCGMFCV